jgi:Tfp pilus assembly protein PilF
MDPRYTPALLGRGEAHARAGRHARALEDFDAYIAAVPDDAYARFRRGLSQVRSGKLEPGIADFSEAIRLDPRLLSAYLERSRAYVTAGQLERAVPDLKEAVELAPRYAQAHNELAWLLATSRRDDMRDGKRALEHARAAAELSGWNNAGILDTYAAALAETGQFAEAASWQERAIALPGFSEPMREQARARLQQYRAGRPFRAP